MTTYLTQFPDGTFTAQIKPFVNERRRFEKAFDAISARPGIVLHAVVSPELKKEISARCDELETACCDLTGSTMEFLANAAQVQPLRDHRRLHRVDDAYCGRINAMSFTLEHDDGLGQDGLGEADIVLVGVSRTGKTPTSIYLAMLGFRVANISLAAQVEPPRQLLDLAPGKTVGLIIDPRATGRNSDAQTDGMAYDTNQLQRSARSPGGSRMEPAAVCEVAMSNSGCNRPGD